MDAEAVKFNWERSLASPCTCKPTWPLAPDGIAVVDPLTLTLTFTQPYAAVSAVVPDQQRELDRLTDGPAEGRAKTTSRSTRSGRVRSRSSRTS